MLKKKGILTIAATAAILMANPMLNKAEAASCTPSAQEKVYVYHTSNVNDFDRILEYFNSHFGKTVTKQPQTNQTTEADKPSQTVTKQPVKTQKPAATKPANTKQPAATQTTPKQTSTLSAYEQKVADLTNQERAKNGLPALKVDVTASKMAHEKSRDMSANGYFSHTSPTYGSPFDMMKKYGITYRYAGENIAMGQRTPEEVVKGWMNSEGHRKNILSPNYTHIGVGYVSQGNYWTQEFIGR